MVKKRSVISLIAAILVVLLCGCSVDQKEADYIHIEVETVSSEAPQMNEGAGSKEVVEDSSDSQPIETYNIQKVLEELEEKSNQLSKVLQEEASSQGEMNRLSGEIYTLWDDELNNLWSKLQEALSEDEMSALVTEEREWIAYKEAEMEAAGTPYEGGSMQPLVINQKAAELTRDRVYVLAAYLGEKIGQTVNELMLGYSSLYVDTQGTSDSYSELELIYQEKGVYEATIGLYRLTTLEGTARVEGDKLLFEDEGMQVKGEIFFQDGGAVFRATESEFSYITPGEEFKFSEKRER